jgi:hypothetical protein
MSAKERRLSDGERTHNGNEKAAARREHRRPRLIEPHPIRKHVASFTVIRSSAPTDYELMEAGGNLLSRCSRFKPQDLERKPVSHEEGMDILNGLAHNIQSGKTRDMRKIAHEVHKLGTLIGLGESATTQIDFAALHVLDSIEGMNYLQINTHAHDRIIQLNRKTRIKVGPIQ